jgi:hypothetical protein
LQLLVAVAAHLMLVQAVVQAVLFIVVVHLTLIKQTL